MKKKVVALFLAAVMTISVLTGCGSQNNEGSSEGGQPESGAAEAVESTSGQQDGGEVEEITYAFATFTSVPSGIQEVEDAINEITEPEIGVHVNLLCLAPANYAQQIALMISSEQDLDMFHTLGDLSSYVSKNQVMELDGLVEEYGKDILAIEPEFFMETGRINDKLYGIPFYMGKALAPTVIFRQDIVDELGIDKESIQSLEDLEKVFEQVSTAHPEMTMLAPLNAGDSGVLYTMDKVDYLTDTWLAPTGCLFGDSTTVENYYESEQFAELASVARKWYEKGYIAADAATTTNLASAQITAGTAFCAIGGYAGRSPEVQFSAPAGGTLGSARLGEAHILTGDVNTLSRVISVNSKHAEAAMKFLNLTYTNSDITTLLAFGIKDRDYIMADETHITYPEGQSAFTVPYNCTLSAVSSNQFIEGGASLLGSDEADAELQKEENNSAWKSKAFGFTFDSNNVKTQYSSVNNVINQYLPGLRCGALDPETELPKFLQALEDAGIQDIIDEKQTQLDAWMAK